MIVKMLSRKQLILKHYLPLACTLHCLRPRVANGCSITHVSVEINGQRMGKTTTYEEETKTGNISALLPLPFSWLSRKATS